MARKRFVPDVGRLVIRTDVTADNETVSWISFRFAPLRKFRNQTDLYHRICCIHNFSAEPDILQCNDPAPNVADIFPPGDHLYYRHYCTDAELLSVKKLWEPKAIKFDLWIAKVLNLEVLLEYEKIRLKRL